MKLSQLIGRPVISITNAKRLGTVDGALAGSTYDEIRALKVKAGEHGQEYLVAAEHIRAVGPDVVTVDSEDSLVPAAGATEATQLPSLTSLIHSRVVTEKGEVLGTIFDVDFNPDTRKILDFEYDGGPLGTLLGRRHTLNPKDIIGVGANMVTVSEAARPTKAA